jgi:hypothetical protein
MGTLILHCEKNALTAYLKNCRQFLRAADSAIYLHDLLCTPNCKDGDEDFSTGGHTLVYSCQRGGLDGHVLMLVVQVRTKSAFADCHRRLRNQLERGFGLRSKYVISRVETY